MQSRWSVLRVQMSAYGCRVVVSVVKGKCRGWRWGRVEGQC